MTIITIPGRESILSAQADETVTFTMKGQSITKQVRDLDQTEVDHIVEAAKTETASN